MPKRWKSIQLDYSALASYDDTYLLSVCLTQRQVAILKALLMTAYWQTRWENLSVSMDVLSAQMAHLDNQLDGNNCEVSSVDFRDNPNDPCEVQYSNDGGETWVTMFRKDVCNTCGSSGDLTIINQSKTEIENNYTTWDGDIINIAPAWEYVDETSDAAICWAIDFYVDAAADVAIAEIQSGNDERRSSNDWWNNVRDIITGAAIAASTVIGLPVAAAAAVAWATIEIADAIWDDIVTRSTSDFSDADARQAIKCAMYDAVKGGTVQWTDWNTSLDGYNPLPNELPLWEVVQGWNSDTDIYINYMLLVQDINTIKASLPECDCPSDRWTHTWNFVTHGKEVWTVSPTGVWEEGVGFKNQVVYGDEDHSQNLMFELIFGEYVPRVDKVKFIGNYDKGHFDENVTGVWVEMLPELDITQNQGAIFTGTDVVKNWDFDYNNASNCKIGIRTSWTDTADHGFVVITSVEFSGLGDDPFEGRVTAPEHEP